MTLEDPREPSLGQMLTCLLITLHRVDPGLLGTVPRDARLQPKPGRSVRAGQAMGSEFYTRKIGLLPQGGWGGWKMEPVVYLICGPTGTTAPTLKNLLEHTAFHTGPGKTGRQELAGRLSVQALYLSYLILTSSIPTLNLHQLRFFPPAFGILTLASQSTLNYLCSRVSARMAKDPYVCMF